MAVVRLKTNVRRAEPLPSVCLVCGQSTDALTSIRHGFYYTNSYAYFALVLPLGLLLLALITAFFTQRRFVETPLCQKHRSYWNQRIVLRITAILAFLVFGYAPMMSKLLNEMLMMMAPAVIIIVISGTLLFRSVRSDAIEYDSMRVINVHDKFAEALHLQREQAEQASKDTTPVELGTWN